MLSGYLKNLITMKKKIKNTSIITGLRLFFFLGFSSIGSLIAQIHVKKDRVDLDAIRDKVNFNTEEVKTEIIENKGQIRSQEDGKVDNNILYWIPRADGNILIRKGGLSIQHNHVKPSSGVEKSFLELNQYRMDIDLVGANRNAKVIATGKSSFYRNYYFSASDFIRNVCDYKKVIFENIYPQIDWVIYVDGNNLKYDFIVKPGGNPADIKMRGVNVKAIEKLENGSLNLLSPLGSYSEAQPISFQGGKEIETDFIVIEDLIKFDVGSYNLEEKLIIDPKIVWGSSIRSKTKDTTNLCGSALDVCERSDNGTLSVIGFNRFDELALVSKLSTSPTASTSYFNSYVLNLDRNHQPQWALYFPGGSDNKVIMTNSEYTSKNDLIIYGHTNKSGLSTGSNIHQSNYSDSFDLCLASIDSLGGINWFTYYGGKGMDKTVDNEQNLNVIGMYAYEYLKINSNDDIIVFGISSSNSGMTNSKGTDTTNSIGVKRIVLSSFKGNDGSMNWGTYLIGSNNEKFGNPNLAEKKYIRWSQLLIDDSENIYVLGETELDSSILLAQNENISKISLITYKINSDGKYHWRKFLNAGVGKFMYVNGGAMSIDGKLLIVGSTNTDTFDINTRHEGKGSKVGYDGYLMQLDSGFNIEWYSFKYVNGYDKMWKVVQKKSGVIVVASDYFTGGYQKKCDDDSGFYTANSINRDKIALHEFQKNGLWMNTWTTGVMGTQVHESIANRLYYSSFQDAVYMVGMAKGENEINTSNGFDSTIGSNSFTAFIAKVETEYDSMLINKTNKSEITCYGSELVIKAKSTNSPFTPKAQLKYSWSPSSIVNSAKSGGDSMVTIKLYQDTTIISRIEDFCIWDTVAVRVKINNINRDTINVRVCPLDSVRFSDGVVLKNIKNDTVYNAIFKNQSGCDSIEFYQIKLNPTSNENKSATICLRGSYTFPDGVTFKNITADTFHLSKFKNQFGCDSVIRTSIKVKFTIGDTLNVTECTEFDWYDSTYTRAGIHSKTFIGADGCDSIVYLHLRLNKFDSTIYGSSCLEYQWEGKTYDSSGNYSVSYKNYLGCDSIIRLNLTIGSYLDTIVKTSCFSYNWNGTLLTRTGYYSDTQQSTLGCDSIITLNLTVDTVDISLSVTPTTILSNSLNSTFQWLDCSESYKLLNGEIAQRYYATANGSYAVEITTKTGCIDTSACVDITGINDNSSGANIFGNNSNITLYPNPTSGNITLSYGDAQLNVMVEVWNTFGQLLQKDILGNGEKFNFTLRQGAGVYRILVYSQSNDVVSFNVIKH